MCSDLKWVIALLLSVAVSCVPYRKYEKIRAGAATASISLPGEKPLEDVKDIVIDSMITELPQGPVLMNAIKDTETGEMIATDVIVASTVTARFRHVAERFGDVSITFDVNVPASLSSSSWQLKIHPVMYIQEDSVSLESIFITGENYRSYQMRGYQRYNAFLASIITDTTDFIKVGQLEVFLKRHYPDTYAMKCDTSLITDPVAENIFGVTQREVLEHYRRTIRWKRNERKRNRIDHMFRRYVKDPILTDGIRLDTVLTSMDGDFTYRYTQNFRSRPGLKKVNVCMSGSLYENGESIFDFKFPDGLTFYISSLSTLADMTPKYRMMVYSRNVYDNTNAFIDFRQGSHELDTTLSENASELRRVKGCIDDVLDRNEYVLDSLVIVASCSPEGPYALNSRLARERSKAVRNYIEDIVPDSWRDSLRTDYLAENWDQLIRLVRNDTVLSNEVKEKIIRLYETDDNLDRVENCISVMPQYRYLREKLYPKLRCVRFDFHLHREGVLKDTIHTTELDTLYMKGVQALKDLDYKQAVTILRPYADYNAALAYTSAGYNHSALSVLDSLDIEDARVCYLKALVLSRLGLNDEAMKYYELSLVYDPYMKHRANLDPELSDLINKRINNLNVEKHD